MGYLDMPKKSGGDQEDLLEIMSLDDIHGTYASEGFRQLLERRSAMRRSGSTRESGVREGILNRLSESYRILTRANPAVHDAEESMDMTVSKGTSATVAESKAAVPFSTAEDQSGADSRLSAF